MRIHVQAPIGLVNAAVKDALTAQELAMLSISPDVVEPAIGEMDSLRDITPMGVILDIAIGVAGNAAYAALKLAFKALQERFGPRNVTLIEKEVIIIRSSEASTPSISAKDDEN